MSLILPKVRFYLLKIVVFERISWYGATDQNLSDSHVSFIKFLNQNSSEVAISFYFIYFPK